MNQTSFFSRIPVVTKNLIIINFIVWLASMALGRRLPFDIDSVFALHFFTSPDFNPAQIVSYMFLHADFMHFFFNMFALFMFGTTIERTLGSKRFLFYYISCGIGAALIQEGVFTIRYFSAIEHIPSDIVTAVTAGGGELIRQGLTYSEPALANLNQIVNIPTVGASGAVYGILLAFGMLYPNQPIYMMFIPIPIKAKYFVIGYGALELFYGFSSHGDGVAHFAHLGGMIFGLLIILYWKRKGLFNGNYY